MQPGAAAAHVLRLVLRLQRLNRVRVFVTVYLLTSEERAAK